MFEIINGQIISCYFGKINGVICLELKASVKGYGFVHTTSIHKPSEIEQIFDVLGVEDIEDIKGSYLRFKMEDITKVKAIGHIVKDIWIELWN